MNDIERRSPSQETPKTELTAYAQKWKSWGVVQLQLFTLDKEGDLQISGIIYVSK